MKHQTPAIWKVVYRIYPPFLRVFEALHIHHTRQDFLLGTLNQKYKGVDLENFLLHKGFETAILAWKDPGEIFSLRLINKNVFQWHIRLFRDGEIRGHYEYSSEGNPLAHVFENCFQKDEEYFKSLLGDYLISH